MAWHFSTDKYWQMSWQNPFTLAFKLAQIASAVMAEWLRRWTRNPMGYSRTGSNPVHSVSLIFFTFKKCLWLAMMGHENLSQGSVSCDGRVVKALDSKSNGIFPRRFEPCSQRTIFVLRCFPYFLFLPKFKSIISMLTKKISGWWNLGVLTFCILNYIFKIMCLYCY